MGRSPLSWCVASTNDSSFKFCINRAVGRNVSLKPGCCYGVIEPHSDYEVDNSNIPELRMTALLNESMKLLLGEPNSGTYHYIRIPDFLPVRTLRHYEDTLRG